MSIDPEADEGDEVGYVPPVFDRHDRPMVAAEIAHPGNPRVMRVIRAGEEFVTDDPHMAEFCRMHLSFQTDMEVLDGAARIRFL